MFFISIIIHVWQLSVLTGVSSVCGGTRGLGIRWEEQILLQACGGRVWYSLWRVHSTHGCWRCHVLSHNVWICGSTERKYASYQSCKSPPQQFKMFSFQIAQMIFKLFDCCIVRIFKVFRLKICPFFLLLSCRFVFFKLFSISCYFSYFSSLCYILQSVWSISIYNIHI